MELESITLKFKNADIKLIARLSVCADDIYALANPSKAAREAVTVKVPVESSEDSEGQEGEIREEIQLTDQLWLDSEKHAWGSPYDEKHREYICELISEITAAGVDSILIDNVFFPSAGDGNDGEYIYLTREEFSKRAEEGEMLEYMEYGDNLYGTPRSELDRIFSLNKAPLLILDINGVKSIRAVELDFQPIIIYLYTDPSTLESRLYDRYLKTDASGEKFLTFAKRKEANIRDYRSLRDIYPLFDAFVKNFGVR